MNNIPSLEGLALKEFGETETMRVEALQELRHRIQLLPLGEQLEDISDNNLIRLLRGRKYDLEKTLHTTIALHKFNDYHQSVCAKDFTYTEMEPFSDFLQVLPYPDEDGHVVVVLQLVKVMRLFTSDFLHRFPHAFLRSNLFFLQQLSHHPYAQVAGVVAVIDFDELTIWDSLKMSTIVTLSNLLTVLHYMQHCVALRLKQVYCFHAPHYILWLWSAIQGVLAESMRQRFHFTTDFSILQETLLKDNYIRAYLPIKYGGDGAIDSHDGKEFEYVWVTEQFEVTSGRLKKETAVSI